MSTVTETPATETPITGEFLTNVDAFAAEVQNVKASATKTGWCQNPGEPAIYSSIRAIDQILDLAQTARASSLGAPLDVCETFLRALSGRPSAVTTDELELFCAKLRHTVS